MRMMRKNLDELMSVLEEIRSNKYPDVPKELVEKVALIQYENQDDRNKGRNETIQVIAQHVNSIGKAGV